MFLPEKFDERSVNTACYSKLTGVKCIAILKYGLIKLRVMARSVYLFGIMNVSKKLK